MDFKWNKEVLTARKEMMNREIENKNELKKQISRLEEAYEALDDAQHEILMAFLDSHGSDRNMAENDFRNPLKKLMDCPKNGLWNLIEIMKSELEYIEKQMETA